MQSPHSLTASQPYNFAGSTAKLFCSTLPNFFNFYKQIFAD